MHINRLLYVHSSVQTCTTFNNQWFFFYSPRRYFLPKRWLISGTRVSQTTFGWITNSGSYQGSLIHKIFAHSWISEVCKHDVEPRGGRFYMYSQRAWFTTLPSASCVKRVRMNLWSPTNPSLNQLFIGVTKLWSWSDAIYTPVVSSVYIGNILFTSIFTH